MTPLSSIAERAGKARKMVSDLCNQREKWLMSIPARPDHDPDLIIASALDGIDELISIVSSKDKALAAMIGTHGEKCADLERGYGLCDAAVDAKKALSLGHEETK